MNDRPAEADIKRLRGDLALARNAVTFWLAENRSLRRKIEALEAEVSRLQELAREGRRDNEGQAS